jgi:hypothetical protein
MDEEEEEANGETPTRARAATESSDDGLTVFREFFENLDVSDADPD